MENNMTVKIKEVLFHGSIMECTYRLISEYMLRHRSDCNNIYCARDRVTVNNVPGVELIEIEGGVAVTFHEVEWRNCGKAMAGNAFIQGCTRNSFQHTFEGEREGLDVFVAEIANHIEAIARQRLKAVARLELQYRDNPYAMAARQERWARSTGTEQDRTEYPIMSVESV
jgi:hypothetical protein